MADRFIIPSLADLSQDIAGPMPLELVRAWEESAKSDADHERLLAPYRRSGTIVCSDSAGLSKLSAARPLVEVMKLVNDPKEIIFSHGSAIGGRAVGVWAADNTQMFYDESVDTNAVMTQMIAAQREIGKGTVQVGIGMHRGVAYEIGDGFYGTEADEIEGFTEEKTHAGEIVVSARVMEALTEGLESSEQRGDMFVIEHAYHAVEPVAPHEGRYPTPFDIGFHDAIRALDASNQKQIEALHARYAQEKTIVLLRVFLPHAPRLLDECAARVNANAVVNAVLGADAKSCLVKANGALAIVATDDPAHAIEHARNLVAAMRERGFDANAGVVRGEVLLFDLENGGRDLAGGPVNIASKLAEDSPDRGAVFIEESVASGAPIDESTPFEVNASGVSIRGVRI